MQLLTLLLPVIQVAVMQSGSNTNMGTQHAAASARSSRQPWLTLRRTCGPLGATNT